MPSLRIFDIDMYYEIQGKGIPIIFINGIGGENNDWTPHVKLLKDDFTTITFDNRGIGRTGRSITEITTQQMAEDTAELMTKLNAHPAIIVGLSMGGLIAQELVINHSHLVKSLILVSTWAKSDDLLKDHFNFEIRLANQIGIDAVWSDSVLWSFSPQFYDNNQDLQNAGIKVLKEGNISPDDFINQAKACINHDSYERLNKINSPTLILLGKEDILTPLRFSSELVKKIPNSKLMIVDGGHAFPVENPKKFVKLIRDFSIDC